MHARLNRVRGLVGRYRTDRRLPPQVLDLYRQASILRVRSRTARRAALVRPVLGSDRRTSEPVLLGSQFVAPIGPLEESIHHLGHVFARAVAAALTSAGVHVFVVDRHGDGLVFGLHQGEREQALDVLIRAFSSKGWLLTWEDRDRSKTIELDDATDDRNVRRARSWTLFQVYSWGATAVGRQSGVELTFWERGTSGELELVGTRGHWRFDPRCPATVEVIDGVEYPGNTAFPVGSDMRYLADPVDIVYTWVDSADPGWQVAFREAARAAGRELSHGAFDPARFRSRDELRYSLRSVWAHCGWARRIYIVTNGQAPEWLRTDDRVRLIPHTDILPDEALPTFNSHAIEAALHRIPDLAEHFVYFNDDVFVGRPLRPEHFFTPNGLSRVFSSGARVPGVEDATSGATDTAARRGRELLLDRFGRVVIDKPLHSPHPQRRSTMEAVASEFPDEVHRTMFSRFRAPTDLSVASSFALHYGVAVGAAVFGDIGAEYVNVESARLDWHLDRLLLGREFDTFCLNETADIGGDVSEREARLATFFEEYFPIAAPWESDGETAT